MTEITGNGVNGSHPSGRKNSVVVPHTNGKATYAELRKVADHFIGGNRLENAPESKVKDFVAANDGHTVITNVSYPLPLFSFFPLSFPSDFFPQNPRERRIYGDSEVGKSKAVTKADWHVTSRF